MIPGGDAVTDPAGHAVAAVMSADSSLDAAMVRAAVEKAGGGRARRRRLAAALDADPSVLATGKSPAPAVVSDLLLALRAGGAAGFSLPCCASCGRETTVPQHHGGHWYCRTCARRLSAHEACASCGRRRPVATRDRAGLPRCDRCPDPDDRDPVAVLAGVVARLDPALPPGAVASAARRVFGREGNLRRLAWMVESDPALLAGDGARAPAGSVLRLIDELAAEGATGISRPACPHCGRVMRLHRRVQGQWSCRRCAARAAAVPCSRCHTVREPATRDGDGRPLCPTCLVRDPVNLEECIRCRQLRVVNTRSADGPVCASCVPRETAVCSVCGRTVPCMTSRATGLPWCRACARWQAECSRCGQVAAVRAGTREAPLCGACADVDADLRRTCTSCGAGGRLASGTCVRCRLRLQLDALLSGAGGQVRPGLEALRDALADAERPGTVLAWLRKDATRTALAALAGGTSPLSHDELDGLPPGKPIEHLRAVLVATGTLPARDEQLARIERWVRQAVSEHADPADREVLHRYAAWHLLRRLRQRNRDGDATYGQLDMTRQRVRAAAGLLSWLREREHTLASCSQADLDAWIASSDATRKAEAGHFVRWAAARGINRGLRFAAIRWTGPARPLDQDERWHQASRLLHDDTIAAADRVAGLLVLLYAQRPATVSRLALDSIDASDEAVRLLLGPVPVTLPEPLASLTLRLADERRGHAVTGDQGASRWLFPGGQPGRPISADRLAGRLRQLGLRPDPCTIGRTVPARHRASGRHPGQAPRPQHQGRRHLAARLRGRLDRIRRRRCPPARTRPGFVTSRNPVPAVAGTGQCPARGGQLPDRDRTRGGRRPQYCSGACRARAYRARRQDGQPPGAGTPPPTAASRHARAVEIRQQVHELTGILADTASGQQALFATPGTTRRARPAAQAGRTLHRLIAELTMLAATASVTKRATKRRPPAEAPQEAPLFEDPDPAAT